MPSHPRRKGHALVRFKNPALADPISLEIAAASARLLCSIGRVSETNDFIERSLVASSGLYVWPAEVLAKMDQPPTLPNRRSRLDMEEEFDGLDEVAGKPRPKWSELIDPERFDQVSSRHFRPLNASQELRRIVAKATLEWAAPARRQRAGVLANAAYMAEAFDLGPEGRDLIELVILAELSSEFEEALNQIDFGKRHQMLRVLANYLGCDTRRVAKLVGPEGVLTRIGLLENIDVPTTLGYVVSTSHSVFSQGLVQEHASVEDFLASFLVRSPEATLEDGETSHLEPLKDLAVPYLRGVCEQRIAGANLMLYGPPGTGKTEVARQLARSAGLQLFEVRHAGWNGDSLCARQRLASLQLTLQGLRGRNDVAVLLDEAEDVFDNDDRQIIRVEDTHNSKAWITRLLESNPVPILWTANRVLHVDPAILRRFAVAYEFSELPRSVKRRLAGSLLGPLGVQPSCLDSISGLPGLSPAQVENAARTVTLARPGDAGHAWRQVQLQLEESRRAMGLPGLVGEPVHGVPYDPGYVNLGGGLTPSQLADGLARTGRAALCFHGAPGTGKTEFARHLARQLDRELDMRAGSDLLSKWVGETERRIAGMFRSAAQRPETVILLLDEADTFLGDRSNSRNHWERSQTNEFLARMEGFPGIFICTTNSVAGLDPAVLRRFQFVVEFKGLREEQALSLFDAAFGRAPEEHEAVALRRLSGKLAPADFSNVVRQLQFLGQGMPAKGLVEKLASECRHRGVGPQERPSVGFVR